MMDMNGFSCIATGKKIGCDPWRYIESRNYVFHVSFCMVLDWCFLITGVLLFDKKKENLLQS